MVVLQQLRVLLVGKLGYAEYLLIVNRLLNPGLFSLVLFEDVTLGDWGASLFCDKILITSETSLVPVGGYDSDFCFVVTIGTCLIDTVPKLGEEIVVGVCSIAPKLLPLLL